MNTSHFDAVIIGGGLAGLTAARSLTKAGHSVILFEATNRVGGRTRNQDVGGVHVDLGGTFVGPDHDRLLALARDVGCSTYATYNDGAQVIDQLGHRSVYNGALPPIGIANLVTIGIIQSQIDRLARSIPDDRPWLAPSALRLDSLSFDDWLRSRHASTTVRDLLTLVARTTWGCELREISFLHVLHYIKAAGGIGPMLATKGGAQQDHFVEGSAEISNRIAASLGDRVRLGSPVTSIEWGDDEVTVTTAKESVNARRLIIAIPPASRDRITFSPQLPEPWSKIGASWPQGVLSKAYAVYERPFWRGGLGTDGRHGLSGQAQSTAGPVFITFDASPPPLSVSEGQRGVLLGFIGGDLARTWDALPAAERRVRALASFAALFGPEALSPIDYVDHRWAEEPWIEGGPTAAPPPGAWTSVGMGLATPVGPIHWAGTETAVRASGFMDGAVRSGESAASKVAAELTTLTHEILN